MMNTMLLLAAMLLPSYRAEDFHYYDENLQARGLPMVNKIYVDVSKPKDKEEFLKFAEKLNLEHFKDIRTNDLDGLLLFFNSKKDVFEALNKCAGKYPAYPVIIFNGIECSVTNEIMAQVHPSVSQEDFLKRLTKVADAKFAVRELKPKLYLLKVEDLKNPANVMVLANLIAKDTFWTKSAMVAWIPIDGYVKANISVETPAISNLGELRNFKVTIDVFSHDINVRTDLLPQLGQSLLPFPFAGEIWFDSSPPEITEVKTSRGKTVTATFGFRQLQYGTFVFQPILVTYEKDGEVYTVKTNTYQYGTRSVIAGTDIDDIQARTNDGLDLLTLRPIGFPKTENPSKIMYFYIKIGISFICFSMAIMFLGGALVSLKNSVSAWLTEDEIEALWNNLKNCDADTQYAYYKAVSSKLNHLMTAVFGVSLYSVDLAHCTNNFKYLVDELDKMYQSNTTLNPESLRDFVKTFCKDRKYR